MKILKRTLILALLIASFSACEKDKTANLDDGIYADIKTNNGEILLNLTYKETPITVANFVSLAEGTNTHVADSTRVGKPFYDGIKFHRVIKKFMIQCGDPKSLDSIPGNDGTGGPGYNFQDEFPKDSTGKLLRTFNKKGLLAMANAGKNTNGSQFFITHVPTPHLNGRHTIFGFVVEGQNVVDTIVKNDFIEKVTIIRKGKEAKAFDANAIFSKALEDFKKAQIAAAEKAKAITIKERASFVKEMTKKGYKIKTYDNGLVIATSKRGRGKQPKAGELIKVDYAGRLTTGVEFDSSYKKAPIEFPVGVGRVIRGWDFGLMQLKVGTKATFFVPSVLGYGARGTGSGIIPPNANLIFDVNLIKVGK